MRLQAYLDENKLSLADFAKLMTADGITTCSEFGVRKWVRGERTPRPDAMRRIEQVTGGAVAPADFISITPITAQPPRKGKAVAA